MRPSRLLIPLFILLSLPGAYLLLLLFRCTQTQLQFQDPVKIIGASTPIRFIAINPHGVRRLTASIEQGGVSLPVFQKEAPAIRWNMFRTQTPPEPFTIEVGSKKVPALKDGKGVLIVEAVSNDLRAQTNRYVFEVEVNTQPPALSVDPTRIVATLGGSGMVAFTTGGYVTESGVRVGKYTFRSWPIPGAKSANRRVSLFAIPHDTSAEEVPIVFARNPSGAEVTGRFPLQLARRKFRTRKIEVSEEFLQKVINELDPGGKGDPLVRFQKVNNNLRMQNNQTLADMRLQSKPDILWKGPFQRLDRSATEAMFCDYRTYFYRHQEVDQQVHLGVDLASTQHAPVTVANDGLVLHAGPLGIYGNAIVVDHGMGLQTLYAHTSQINVKVGDQVKKNQIMGQSGMTGLAGGDHLHFTIQVEGVPVNPNEWWDEHWIHDRVLDRLKTE